MVVTLTVSCIVTVHASDDISELHMSEDEVMAQVNRIYFLPEQHSYHTMVHTD